MKVAVVGTGYVGLVSGVSLAAKGHKVTCVDLDETIVSRLNSGEPTIFEKGLPELLAEVIQADRFSATTQLAEALDNADLVMIAVGTPSKDGVIDLTYVRSAARQIGEYLATADHFITVIVKSTVIPGTTDTVVRQELESASGKTVGEFGLGMNPEFLREGEAIEDFMYPDRIVLGHETDKALEMLEELYAPWNVDKVRVNTRTAEMIKYANNTLLAIQISAVNELANLAAALGGIDVMDVVDGIQLDKRWNPIENGNRVNPQVLSYLVPGCGFGGSCFPKDVQALRSQGVDMGLPMHVMNAVLNVNDAQPRQVVDILSSELGPLEGKKVLVLGLAFKPGTDDVRESASIKIINTLLDAGASIEAHDPIAVDHFKRALGNRADAITYVDNWQDTVAGAEVVVLATRWPEYSGLAGMDLSGKTVFDARRMLSPTEIKGATYLSIGRRHAA